MTSIPKRHVFRLRNPVRDYAWGSRRAIAELQGRKPSDRPEAELWLGAHGSAPSEISIAGEWHRLDEVIAAHPEKMLGAELARGRGELPFLLKVLAAERPLSLQAHPDARRAEEGFAAEEAEGIPRGARHRNYPDPRHKPELIYALTPFTVMRGFRAPEEIVERFESVGLEDFPPLRHLRGGGDGPSSALRAFFAAYLDLDPSVVLELLRRLLPLEESHEMLERWIHRLAEEYPDDRGIFSPLFLHVFRLAPGEAIYTGAGVLHAYLEGVGVEVMAASDNVLRGGLTAKHIDADELLRVVRYEVQEPQRVVSRHRGSERIFETAASEFRLSRVELGAGERADLDAALQILLVVDGEGELREGVERGVEKVARGDSFFIRPGGGTLHLRGPLRLFRATRGES